MALLKRQRRLEMLYVEAGRQEEADEQFHLWLRTRPKKSGYCTLGRTEHFEENILIFRKKS
jgi:hypothetical protein